MLIASEARVRQVIADLHYDFRQFTLDDFVQHIQRRRQREILRFAFPFYSEVHALWTQWDTADYILYDRNTHAVHQNHHVLHELGHIVLEHPLLDLEQILSPDLVVQLKQVIKAPLMGYCRSYVPFDTPEDREAEYFVRCLREHILQAGRWSALTHPVSSIDELTPFVRSLGYSG